MLKSFSVENYRAFADETTIELRPLTLLFGYNNVGKSALIRALALIADSTRSDTATPLDLYSKAARGCTFAELCSKVTGSNTIGLRLCFSLPKGELRAEYHVTQPATTYVPIIDELRLSIHSPDSSSISFVFEWQPDGTYQCRSTDTILGDGRIEFGGLLLSDQTFVAPLMHPNFLPAVQWLNDALLDFGRRFYWLGSLRNHPPRIIEFKGTAPKLIGSDGAGMGEFLVLDKLNNGPLLGEVSRWYEDNFRRKLDVKQLSEGRFSLTLEPLTIEGDRAVNLADTGEGIAQVLPVLVAAAAAHRRGTGDPRILAIEQPELHLHPAVHAPLAKYLCDLAASDQAPRMLVETHSENFLLGVQIQIVKREISPDDVLVYWVKQDEDGSSRVQRITFDPEGYPLGFPESVFNEDLELARLLLDLREQASA